MFASKSHSNAAKQKPDGPFFSPLVQPKLKVNRPGDKHEQEADAIADQVVSQSKGEGSPLSVVKSPVLQRKADDEDSQVMPLQRAEEEEVQAKEEEEQIQAMEEEESVQAMEEETIQTKTLLNKAQATPNPSASISALKATKGSGFPLHNQIKQPLEKFFNSDFSGVRIHVDSKAETLTSQLNAKAFTHKNDIYFNQGQFNPNSKAGKFLLAHELTHTLQQGASKQKPLPKQNKVEDQTDVKPKEEKPKQNKSKVEKVISTPTNPHEDPAFKSVIRQTKTVSRQQKAHQPVEENTTEIKESSYLSKEEQEKKNDQQTHIAGMNSAAESEKKKDPITAESFKALLKNNLDSLEKQIPNNEKEAKEFKEQKPIQGIKQNIAGTVTSENQKISSPLAAESKKEDPPKSGLPTREAKELAPKPAAPQPLSINKQAAVPKGKQPSEISLQKESSSLDNYMAENQITETQLGKSNEPKFIKALGQKKDAQNKAEQAPQQYRAKEQKVLSSAGNQANRNANSGFMAMQSNRSSTLGQVESKQINTQTADKAEQQKVFAELESIYTTTKTNVTKILEGLSSEVNSVFETKAEKAKQRFEKNVESKLSDIYGWTVIDDMIFGEDTEAIEKVFQQERAQFVSTMNQILDNIAKLIADKLNEALSVITTGKEKADSYFNSLSEEQKRLGQEAYDQFSGKYEDLENTVNEKQKELAESLAQQYKQNVVALRESFDKIKQEVSVGWIGGALNALKEVADTIRKLKEMVIGLLSAISSVISVILGDPVGFMKNLFAGIKEGFFNFAKNINKHLIGGFVTWLTGTLGPVGIDVPENLFSLSGIFSLVMQVLGLGWDFVRKKAVLLLGEPAVQVLEQSVETFKLIKEKGISGIWELVRDKFTDIKEAVIDEIRNMLVVQIISAGVKWIAGLLFPAAGFVKAIKAIYDVVTFFVQSAIMLIPAITKSILALASGSVKMVSKSIEKALAVLIPIVINLFSKILGISGLSKKVNKIIGKLRKRIDKQITKLILKAKAKLKSLLKSGKKKVKGAVRGVVQWWKKKKKFKTKDGKNHSIFFKGKGKKSKLTVKSDPQTIGHIIKSKKWKIGKNPSEIIDIDDETINALKIQTTIIDDNREAMSKKDGKDIQLAFEEIVKILDKLGLPALPNTHVIKKDIRPGTADGTEMGEHVFVKPLSLNPGGLSGSQPTIDSVCKKTPNPLHIKNLLLITLLNLSQF